MNLHIGRRGALASLGLICAATLWAVNMQLGQVLPYPACRHQLPLAGLSSLAATAVSLVAGFCSWWAYRALGRRPQRRASAARRSLHLLAGLGAGSALLFLVALVLQTLAGFILTGCER
jgi:hypothetical protein